MSDFRLKFGMWLVSVGRWVIPCGFGIRYHLRPDVLEIRNNNPVEYNKLDVKLRVQ